MFYLIYLLYSILNPFTNSKKYKRLQYYECNFRIYNSLQGIVKPKVENGILFAQALELLEEKIIKLYIYYNILF